MNQSRDGFRKLWAMPLGLAIISLSGLIVALLGDGIWDWLSTVMLAAPLLVAIFHLRKALRRSP